MITWLLNSMLLILRYKALMKQSLMLGTHWGFKSILNEDFKFLIKSNIILTWSSLKSHNTKMLWLILKVFCGNFLKQSEIQN